MKNYTNYDNATVNNDYYSDIFYETVEYMRQLDNYEAMVEYASQFADEDECLPDEYDDYPETVSMNQKPEWVTGLIGDDYKNWTPGIYAFSMGTGRGKTKFVAEYLVPYAKSRGKKVLYLCNRELLLKQTQKDMKGYEDTVAIMTYQKLEATRSRNMVVDEYDYIICDEAHFFLDDAEFNPATDVPFKFVMGRRNRSVVLLMSATAIKLFTWLQKKGILDPSNLFTLEQDYDYVDHVFLYKSDAFFTIIDNLLQRDDNSKIVAFVNERRMIRAHQYYGDRADYMCSRFTKSSKMMRICGIREVEVPTGTGAGTKKERTAPQVIVNTKDGRRTFEKRILFATKVMDNGVSLKDSNIKAVFCELLDQDALVQSLGRKRRDPYDRSDRCSFYIKNYQTNWITGSINRYQKWLEQAALLHKKRNVFETIYEKPGMRDAIKNNKILYADKNGWHVNYLRHRKYMAEKTMMEMMLESGYEAVLRQTLGEKLSSKLVTDYTEPVLHDDLKAFLLTIAPDEMLFKDRQNEIKTMFRNVGLDMGKVALKNRRPAGIVSLNGVLEDRYGDTFTPRFTNKNDEGNPLVDRRRRLNDGSVNPNRDRHYWLLRDP